jgi:hypothetical protein
VVFLTRAARPVGDGQLDRAQCDGRFPVVLPIMRLVATSQALHNLSAAEFSIGHFEYLQHFGGDFRDHSPDHRRDF